MIDFKLEFKPKMTFSKSSIFETSKNGCPKMQVSAQIGTSHSIFNLQQLKWLQRIHRPSSFLVVASSSSLFMNFLYIVSYLRNSYSTESSPLKFLNSDSTDRS